MALAVVAAVVLVAVVTASVWPDVVPFRGYPRGDEALVGMWEGHYLGYEGRLSLDVDHTFLLEVCPMSLAPGDSTGTWEYSKGALRLSPGLLIQYDVKTGTGRYIELPEREFKVQNTIMPWKRIITDVEGGTLFHKK